MRNKHNAMLHEKRARTGEAEKPETRETHDSFSEVEISSFFFSLFFSLLFAISRILLFAETRMVSPHVTAGTGFFGVAHNTRTRAGKNAKEKKAGEKGKCRSNP